MSDSGTLSALIEEANFKLRWFDLGRRLQSVSKSTAAAFEAGLAPWPHPYLRQAWTGLLLQPAEGGEPIIWFLRFPLDEQGKLQLQARDGLLRSLAQELQQTSASESAAQLDQLLQQSGLLFTPSTERQAAFHAQTSLLLARPPSEHYQPVLRYVGNPKTHRWDNLAFQGIADLTARWEKESALLLRQMNKIAAPVFISLCHCLENQPIDHRLAAAVISRTETEFAEETPDLSVVAATVRAISHSPASGLRHTFLHSLLLTDDTCQNSEILAAIGSRCVLDLEDPELARLWLSGLASAASQPNFNLLLSDLMFIPQIRATLLGALRDPTRKESLAIAFGNFLHGTKATH
ncbi:DUF3549 family protein [Microbulbifer sp. OS29]|uniref:DUF3549 family protein n=1 Tax=Microbulbifer okhotskensis TaxID=2926617 RepID=A0A9X2ELK3_9GAMM|nr:DUF3549 family protein [Microbulbifer okhotskensis]MCO1333805.1 DUF3549 family protein [Microbulbifer okhotskensis]